MRRTFSVLGLVLASILVSGCSLLVFIEDRLEPPQPESTGMTFRYKAPAARQVNVAGEFNNWLGTANGGRLDPNIDAMSDLDDDGIWEITLPLPPGRYQYKFVVDQVDWQSDPANPESFEDGFGGLNSILVVPADIAYDHSEAYISHSLDTGSRSRRQISVVFALDGHATADEVFLAGEFNEWSAESTPLAKGADGVWRVEVSLSEGDHAYKFVVDGEWIVDPANPDTIDDGYGGVNSVVNVRR